MAVFSEASSAIFSAASGFGPITTSPSTTRSRVARASILPAAVSSSRASVSAPPTEVRPSSDGAGA